MANKTLFKGTTKANAPPADTKNEAGGTAYQLEPRAALAQLAATGCLNGAYYASAQTQLDGVLEQAKACDYEYVLKVAIYAGERGFMKDMPSLLLAHATTRVTTAQESALLHAAFARVCYNARMVRNFVQIMRSGQVGRKSLGTLPKRLVQGWFARQRADSLFRQSLGNDPSLADVIKMTHPKPTTPGQAATLRYLIGKPVENEDDLPALVRQYEAYKAGARDGIKLGDPPDVPFQMLTALDLGPAEWTKIAQRCSWQTLRMNLNTFRRHDVFKDDAVTTAIAARLIDPAEIRRARVFPYQLLAAAENVRGEMPPQIEYALQVALDLSLENVPEINGMVYICPDISGSMRTPVTGDRGKGATSKVQCNQVAALVAAAIAHRQPTRAHIIPFADNALDVYNRKEHKINHADSVLTLTRTLAALPSGGTTVSAPLARMNQKSMRGDLVIIVSDNESWTETLGFGLPDWRGRTRDSTRTMDEWLSFKKRNPQAKLVCIDLQPYTTTQAQERDDILNVGGFSDAVFDLLAAFANGGSDANHWVEEIERIQITRSASPGNEG